MKYKSEQSGPKIKASLNLHENSHSRQFEDSECKYDMTKCFSNSNPNLRKCMAFVQLQ